MCSINLEHSDVWVESAHKARTPKPCSCCGGEIKPADRYIKHFSKYDGSVFSDAMCLTCEKDRAEFAEEHGHQTPTPSAFYDILAECVDDTEDDRWGVMFSAMKARSKAKAN